jgi:uncharacterized membrane protein
MKDIIGVVLIIGGIVLGVYVGVWVCFVGGIVDVIEQIRAENLEAVAIAWGIAKVVCSSFFGFLAAVIPIIAGKLCLTD